MKLQYTFTRQFFLRGLHPQTPAGGPLAPKPPSRGDSPLGPAEGVPPSALPHMEEYTYFWGVNTSWGINTAESKRPLNQEDNQAPQPTIVSIDGVRIDSSKVEAIQTLSLPKSRKEVQSFLGKINFLRRFVSNFVELVNHITVMLRKGNEVKWTAESRESFSLIKKALNEAPVLVSPDYSKDFQFFYFAYFDMVVVVLL
jgi:hypothetical protein